MDGTIHFEGRLRTVFSILIFPLFLIDSHSQSVVNKSFKPNKTFSYKTVGKIQVKADFFSTADNSNLKPVIIWIHGGGLIFGSRGEIPEEQLNFYLRAGYSLVSVDYRLAPETKLPEIVHDIGDALRWIHNYGSDSLGIDPNRIFIVGHSGGAYLALMSGYSSGVRPRAIVSFYGYGDIRSEWYNMPAHLSGSIISEATAQKLIRDSILTSAPVEERLSLYLYARQKGIWPLLVTDHSPKKEREWFKRYCPIENIDSGYPPVLLIHGDKDTDVPFTESVQLKDKLDSKGIKNKLIRMKNYGHVFDLFEGGLSNPDIVDVFDEVIVYLNQFR